MQLLPDNPRRRALVQLATIAVGLLLQRLTTRAVRATIVPLLQAHPHKQRVASVPFARLLVRPRPLALSVHTARPRLAAHRLRVTRDLFAVRVCFPQFPGTSLVFIFHAPCQLPPACRLRRARAHRVTFVRLARQLPHRRSARPPRIVRRAARLQLRAQLVRFARCTEWRLRLSARRAHSVPLQV